MHAPPNAQTQILSVIPSCKLSSALSHALSLSTARNENDPDFSEFALTLTTLKLQAAVNFYKIPLLCNLYTLPKNMLQLIR